MIESSIQSGRWAAAFHTSPAGLTRGSISFARRWVARHMASMEAAFQVAAADLPRPSTFAEFVYAALLHGALRVVRSLARPWPLEARAWINTPASNWHWPKAHGILTAASNGADSLAGQH
jgi:hypothetical protein